MLPAWAWKAIGFALLVGAVVGGWQWREHVVYQRGYDAAKTERKADDEAAMRVATAQAHADQVALSGRFLLAQRDRFQENRNAQATIDDLRNRVRTGAVVLRLPTGSAVCASAPGGDSAAGAGPSGEGGSVQLVPGTADAFVSIGGRIAAGVRRENNLIDAYNTARAACNAH